MTTATDPNIHDVAARLQQEEAAVGVARNVLNANTARELEALHDREQNIRSCIWVVTSVPRELEAEQLRFADLEERRAIVLTKEMEFEQRIAEAPDWRTSPTSRERDADYDRQRTLQRQLQLLRAGTLLSAPNQVFARVGDLDALLKQSSERIETLQAQLDASVRQAEQLLAETVTS
jgi:hypothetical protein